jgi:hypothetical protein
MTDCPHVNIYKDDFIGDYHCDDCGACWPAAERPDKVDE